jgi:hypothetical protein
MFNQYFAKEPVLTIAVRTNGSVICRAGPSWQAEGGIVRMLFPEFLVAVWNEYSKWITQVNKASPFAMFVEGMFVCFQMENRLIAPYSK